MVDPSLRSLFEKDLFYCVLPFSDFGLVSYRNRYQVLGSCQGSRAIKCLGSSFGCCKGYCDVLYGTYDDDLNHLVN